MKKKDYTNEELASFIDHTCLKPGATKQDIVKLCREAKKYHFASVCVNPCYVELAKSQLGRSAVKVCTVVDFPLGQSLLESKCAEARYAFEYGAKELDFVMNASLLRDDPEEARVELCVIIKFCRVNAPGAVTKLIIECCNLTDEEKVMACRFAKEAGFDFVKTSTGFGKGGATVEDVKLMRRTIGRKMGLKAAGGIRTREDAVAMLRAGATRLGCSAGVAIMRA